MQLDVKEKAALDVLVEKYSDLVWAARKEQTDMEIPAVAEAMERVCDLYPEEIGELQCCEHGDFAHGFNSGMLAGMRFVLALHHHGLDAAHAEFPDLDT